jgi:hypothetical protein
MPLGNEYDDLIALARQNRRLSEIFDLSHEHGREAFVNCSTPFRMRAEAGASSADIIEAMALNYACGSSSG